jgi:glycerol uptake facilitator-like aquaporin
MRILLVNAIYLSGLIGGILYQTHGRQWWIPVITGLIGGILGGVLMIVCENRRRKEED